MADTPQKTPRAPTPEEFADACEGILRVDRREIVAMMTGETFGNASPRYDQATVDKVAGLLDHAGQLLQAAMPTLPRSVVRRERQVAAAKGDGEFQAFLAAALQRPAKPRRKRPGAAP